jgi:hypothetical protein
MANFENVDYDTAHKIVNKNKNMFWDGWTIVEWRRDPDGYFSKNGMFRNGQWGKVVRNISVSNDGTWKVPVKYAVGR